MKSESEVLLMHGYEDFIVDTYLLLPELRKYRISVEGYMGFEKLTDGVELYKEFLGKIESYMKENNMKLKQESEEHSASIYKTRAIEIHKDDYYWIFLDSYEGYSMQDIYDYLKDVIYQLLEFDTSDNNKTQ